MPQRNDPDRAAARARGGAQFPEERTLQQKKLAHDAQRFSHRL
jgi:hypothetical protein